MLNNLYLVNASKKSSNFMTGYYEAQKGLFLTRSLFSLGYYATGIMTAKRAIKLAKKNELWDILFSVAGVMADYYAARGKSEKVEFYSETQKEAIGYLESERIVKHVINKWSLYFSKKTRADKSALMLLKNDLKSLEGVLHLSPSAANRHFYYRIQLLYFDSMLDYKQALEVCDNGIEFLNNNKNFNDPRRMGIYWGSKMYCYLNLREFKKAQQFAQKAEHFFIKGTLNWYRIMEYYFVLSIQTSNYKTAHELLSTVQGIDSFQSITKNMRQKWLVLEAYMEFVIMSGIWSGEDNVKQNKNFSVGKFINDVPIYFSDKTGTYVSILILQIVFLILKNQYDFILEKKDSLTRFIRRYLYTKENERSRIFLTFLKRVIEQDFSYSKTMDKSKRLKKRLLNIPMNYSANIGGNEIVPYEILWKWVLDKLKEGRYGVS